MRFMEKANEATLEKFEELKKNGYGYFTYDTRGELAGVAFNGPDVLIPANDKVGQVIVTRA
jgi:hypothetical protein